MSFNVTHKYVMVVLCLVSEQWNKMESDGPPPAPRLDFGCCVARLRVPDNTGSGAGDDLKAASQQAQQALEGLRIGSAGSTSRAHVGDTATAAVPEGSLRNEACFYFVATYCVQCLVAFNLLGHVMSCNR